MDLAHGQQPCILSVTAVRAMTSRSQNLLYVNRDSSPDLLCLATTTISAEGKYEIYPVF